MKVRNAFFIVALCLSFAMAVQHRCVLAQDSRPASRPQAVALRLDRSAVVPFKLSTTSRSTLITGTREVTASSEQNFEFDVAFAALRADGAAEVTFRFRRIWGSAASSLGKVTFDTATTPERDPAAVPSAARLRLLTASPARGLIDSRGVLVRLRASDEFYVMTSSTPESVIDLLLEIFHGLHAKEVAKDDVWTTSRTSLMAHEHFVHRFTNRILTIEDDRIIVDRIGRAEFVEAHEHGAEAEHGIVEKHELPELTESKSIGRTVIAIRDGLPLEAGITEEWSFSTKATATRPESTWSVRNERLLQREEVPTSRPTKESDLK